MKKAVFLAIPIAVAIILIVGQRGAGGPALVEMAPNIPNSGVVSSAPSLDILPTNIVQGDPAEIVISGLTSTSSVRSLTWNGKSLKLYEDNGEWKALVGIDLKLASGSYPVALTMRDGQVLKKNLVVGRRVIAEAPLGIPYKLGGNTKESANNLVSNLAAENSIISAVPSAGTRLWSGTFRFPLDPPVVVTDPYGYTRLTINTTVSHKGTDFRAAVGTPVYAVQSGVVRMARSFTDYGETIIVDHGLGLQTLYMHLSEIDVQIGDTVARGEALGKSGETGYAEAPHLHLSVKINGVSIDPMKFMSLLGER